MKVSLAWIFDYIDADWRSIDVDDLVDRFNRITAEIEGVEHFKIDLDKFFLCCDITSDDKPDDDSMMRVMTAETKDIFTLPKRDDFNGNGYAMVYADGATVCWATQRDFGADKDGLLPIFTGRLYEYAGHWKKHVDTEDYILEVDNKSITNRPDLWGHRGFAREVAAILDLPFKPIDEFVTNNPVEQHDTGSKATKEMPYSITIDTPVCKRFAGIYLDGVKYYGSDAAVAARIARLGNKVISLYVDLTNYVMLDVGEPMHAFDAHDLKAKSIGARMAKKGEKLLLLDDSELELTPEDCVIVDGDTPVSLAGIMGGKATGVSPKMNSLFLEAANFDAGTIRKSAARHKIRTESSARFEKSLDPNWNITAIKRFLKLLEGTGIENAMADTDTPYNKSQPIVSVGKPAEPQIIKVSQDFIDTRLGVEIPSDFIVKTLKKLDFGVKQSKGIYTVTVPTFRGTKDVTIPEDIVEEIARFYGYNNIPYTLPSFPMKPSSTFDILTKRAIKDHMAFALNMHEANNYAFADEEWLAKLQWQPDNAVYARNPLSQNAQRLVTSLVPALLKNVSVNSAQAPQVRLFEWGRRWWLEGKGSHEQHSLGAVAWSAGTVDFYETKQELMSLFDLLRLPIAWRKPAEQLAPWYDEHQTAALYHGEHLIGYAGMGNQSFINRVVDGMAFIIEIDAGYLLEHKPAPMHFTPLAKYPRVTLDVSALMPLALTVDALSELIRGVDERIYDVQLQDVFEKDEWGDKRSITMRYYLRDDNKTLDKIAIDTVQRAVEQAVVKAGGEIR